MDLWEVAAKYWSSAANPATDLEAEETMQLLEYDLRWRSYDIGDELGIENDKLERSLVEIFDASTGGAFKNPQRQADPKRLADLRAAIVSFRGELSTARAAALRKVFQIGH